MATRFVEIWTLRRGPLLKARTLNADEQVAAHESWLAAEPARFDARVAAPGPDDPQRVVWIPTWKPRCAREPNSRVERLMRATE